MEMKKIILLTMFLTLASCGGGGSSSGGGSNKDLFSLWIEDGTSERLDLTGLTFGDLYFTSFYFDGAAECRCSFRIIGEQSTGNYVLNSCRFVFGSGSPEPNCAILNRAGTYSKTSSVLTTNDKLGQSTYR